MEGFAGGSEMSFPSGMKHWKDEEAGLGISDRPRVMPRWRFEALPLPGTSTIGPMSIPRGWSWPPCSFSGIGVSARIADDTEKTPESGRVFRGGPEMVWLPLSVYIRKISSNRHWKSRIRDCSRNFLMTGYLWLWRELGSKLSWFVLWVVSFEMEIPHPRCPLGG